MRGSTPRLATKRKRIDNARNCGEGRLLREGLTEKIPKTGKKFFIVIRQKRLKKEESKISKQTTEAGPRSEEVNGLNK